MEGFHTSPGSYFKEKNLSQRIAQISVTIAAIVAPSDRGPVGERTLVTGIPEFKALFGLPNPRLTKAHYAALEILKSSGRLYFTRIVQTDPKKNRPLSAGAFCTVDDLKATQPRVSLSVFGDGSGKPKGVYDPLNNVAFNPGSPGVDQMLFAVYAQNPGEWNNNLYVRIRTSLPRGVSTFDANVDPTVFFVDVFENYVNPKQTPDESFKVARRRTVDGLGNQLHIEEVINNKSKLIRVKNNELCDELPIFNPCDVYFDGGTNGDPVTVGRFKDGWSLYADPEISDVNLLVQGGAPSGMALIDISDIHNLMLDIAERRADCSAVLDLPETEQEPANAVAYRRQMLNRSSSYGAMFAPYVTIKDTDNDLNVSVPPSGFIAAACAQTDAKYHLWFAAAGMVRGSLPTVKSARVYKWKERDVLNDAQINAIRYFPDGSGYKIWGADTLEVEATATNYWPVRRLLCYMEKSISVAAQYSVFDPNDEKLWDRLTELCERFLTPIKNGRGLSWFQVVCNDKNNTPDTIAAGDTMLDVYVDPVLFAKRIHLNAIIVKTGGIAKFKEYAKLLGRGGS